MENKKVMSLRDFSAGVVGGVALTNAWKLSNKSAADELIGKRIDA